MNSPHSPSGPVFTAPAKKQLGQHFLADRHYIDKIVMAVNPKDGDRLVEIGPGQGAITLPLLRPILALVLIMTIIGSFQVFDTVSVTTQGGPADASRVLQMYIYQNAFA